MSDRLAMAGEVLSASAFFAGLLLAYLGSAVAGFQSYPTTAQESVQRSYFLRAWIGFVAFLIALVAGLLAFLADWNNDVALLCLGVWALALSGVLALGCALLTALEVPWR